MDIKVDDYIKTIFDDELLLVESIDELETKNIVWTYSSVDKMYTNAYLTKQIAEVYRKI